MPLERSGVGIPRPSIHNLLHRTGKVTPKTSKKQTERLLALRAQIQRDIERLEEDVGMAQREMAEQANREDRIAEIAALMQNQEADVTLEEHLRKLLAQVEVAVEAVEEGTYGICVSCGGPIPEERLAAVPYADRCVACQRKQEKR